MGRLVRNSAGGYGFGVLRLEHLQVCDCDNRVDMLTVRRGGGSGILNGFVVWGHYGSNIDRTLWSSGLRRWLTAPDRKGVGSNHTSVIAKHLET